MGLKYSSGDSRSIVEALTANLTQGQNVLTRLAGGNQHLVASLGIGELTGEAYGAAGALFEGQVGSSIRGAQQLLDSVQKDLDSYTSADSRVSGFGVLDEDQMEVQLRATRAQRDATERLIEVNRVAANVASVVPALGESLQMVNRQLETVVTQLEASIADLQGRLRALRAFDAAISGLFLQGASGPTGTGSIMTVGNTSNADDLNKQLDTMNDYDLMQHLLILQRNDPETYWDLLAAMSIKNLERLEKHSYLDRLEPRPEIARGGTLSWLKRFLQLPTRIEQPSWKSPLTRIRPEAWGKDDWLRIRQGGIKDCWLVAALDIELRDNPDWVKDNVTVNANGTVTVKLFDPDTGKRVKVTVTDRLLYTGYNDESKLFGIKAPEIAAYIEKASAEIYVDRFGYPTGSYAAIDGGWSGSAIGMFSGRGAEWVPASKGASELQSALDNGQSAIVNSPTLVSDTAFEKGFVGNHAFVVDRIEDGKVYLLNPWNPREEDYKVTLTFEQYEDWASGVTIIDKVSK